jgi:nitrous oxide reductase accessory protein NosL
MAPRLFALFTAAMFALTALLTAPPAARAGEIAPCSECGMTAKVEGRFTVRIGEDQEARYFCDIGDFVAFLARTKPEKLPAASVHDFPTGEWIDAAKALYVRDPRYQTPMGWGVAAFSDRTAAAAAGAPLTFDELRASLKP